MDFAQSLRVSLSLCQVFLKKQVFMDAADAFRQLKVMKQWRMTVFVANCISFVFVTYR